MRSGQGGNWSIRKPNWRYKLPRNAIQVPILRVESLSDYTTLDLTLLPVLAKSLTQIPADYLSFMREIESKAGYKEQICYNECKMVYYILNRVENQNIPSQVLGKFAFRFEDKLYIMHIDRDNVYCYAMRAMTIMKNETLQVQNVREGVWFEFREFTQVARVSNSLPIGFNSNYKKLQNVEISAQSLLENVGLIKDFFKETGVDIRYSLDLIWAFLMEGARFSTVRAAFHRCLTHPKEETQTIGSRGWTNLIYCWGRLSAYWSAFVMGDNEDGEEIMLDGDYALKDVEKAIYNLRIIKLCNGINRTFRLNQIERMSLFKEIMHLWD